MTKTEAQEILAHLFSQQGGFLAVQMVQMAIVCEREGAHERARKIGIAVDQIFGYERKVELSDNAVVEERVGLAQIAEALLLATDTRQPDFTGYTASDVAAEAAPWPSWQRMVERAGRRGVVEQDSPSVLRGAVRGEDGLYDWQRDAVRGADGFWRKAPPIKLQKNSTYGRTRPVHDPSNLCDVFGKMAEDFRGGRFDDPRFDSPVVELDAASAYRASQVRAELAHPGFDAGARVQARGLTPYRDGGPSWLVCAGPMPVEHAGAVLMVYQPRAQEVEVYARAPHGPLAEKYILAPFVPEPYDPRGFEVVEVRDGL